MHVEKAIGGTERRIPTHSPPPPGGGPNPTIHHAYVHYMGCVMATIGTYQERPIRPSAAPHDLGKLIREFFMNTDAPLCQVTQLRVQCPPN